MANRPREAGPTAARVAQNVRSLRRGRGMELSHLAERLQELGQPIGVPGLSRLENGERRVDVDDLAALAVALDVSPARLLLPETAGSEPASLTPTVSVDAARAWLWAAGEAPLTDGSDEDVAAFRAVNRPHREDVIFKSGDIRRSRHVLAPVKDAALAAVAGGATWSLVKEYLDWVEAFQLQFGQPDDGTASKADDGQPE